MFKVFVVVIYSIMYKFDQNMLRNVGVRALTGLNEMIWTIKGHNSHKNNPFELNFKLVQGIRSINVQYEFNQCWCVECYYL